MRNKPRHELCVDKTSCKSEHENQGTKQSTSAAETSSPTYKANPTGPYSQGDVIKKQHMQSQQNNIQ